MTFSRDSVWKMAENAQKNRDMSKARTVASGLSKTMKLSQPSAASSRTQVSPRVETDRKHSPELTNTVFFVNLYREESL